MKPSSLIIIIVNCAGLVQPDCILPLIWCLLFQPQSSCNPWWVFYWAQNTNQLTSSYFSLYYWSALFIYINSVIISRHWSESYLWYAAASFLVVNFAFAVCERYILYCIPTFCAVFLLWCHWFSRALIRWNENLWVVLLKNVILFITRK